MAKAQSGVSLETIKKNVFWICTPIALLIAVGITFYSAGNVSKTFNDRKAELQRQKEDVDKLKTNTTHPNQRTIDQIVKRVNELKGSVREAWTILQRDQEERNTWSEEELGSIFVDEIRNKKFGDEITWDNRERYRQFIERTLPAMEASVRPLHEVYKDEEGNWVPLEPFGPKRTGMGNSSGASSYGSAGDSGGAGPRGSSARRTRSTTIRPGASMDGAGGLQEELVIRTEGVLDWPNPEIYSTLGNWSPSQPPGPKEIWYLQENIWVYRALLSVIQNVNANATGIHNATIKRIEGLKIGKEASALIAERTKQEYQAPATGGGLGGMDSMSSSGGPGGMSGAEGMGGGDTAFAGMEDAPRDDLRAAMLRDYRYVGESNAPLRFSDPPQYPQFNRMPVCLQLVVNQTKVPDILIECANCDMPMDILWVRLNPGGTKPFDLSPDVTGAGMMSGSGGAGGGGGGYGIGGGGGGGGGPSGYSSGGGSSSGGSGGMNYGTSVSTSGPGGDSGRAFVDGSTAYGTESMMVEIYGVINIFNSPEHTEDLQLDPTTDEDAATPEGEGEKTPEDETGDTEAVLNRPVRRLTARRAAVRRAKTL